MQDFGLTPVPIGYVSDNLIYDDYPIVDRVLMIKKGEVVKRGDILAINSEGRMTTPIAADPDNAGSGTLTITDLAQDAVLQTITCTYDGANWDITGSVGGSIATDKATGVTHTIAGIAKFRFDAGDVAFETGDVFTFQVKKSGMVLAFKATIYADLIPSWSGGGGSDGIAICGRDVDATAEATPGFGYVAGKFNSRAIGNWNALVADGGDVENIISALQERNIHVKEAEPHG